jgi:hypothetical protein
MAASPVSIVPSPASNLRRRPLALTPRRLDANRRNAARSTGPRTVEGKAKVARNGIKHGFFAAREKWTPRQQRDFEDTLAGLRDDFKPDGILEEGCVATIAASYVRMAAMLRWENIAALRYHEHRDRELNQRIAVADPAEAAFLEATRTALRRAGLWVPTIPGSREANAIIRYSGSLDRTIRRASHELEGLKALRSGGISRTSKVQKQTHYSASPRSGRAPAEGPRVPSRPHLNVQKQTHFEASSPIAENAKANPLSSMFTGNRHARRRAKALAARRT